RAARVGHPAELREAADVNEQFRIGEPEPQQRQKALAPGDHLGDLAAVGQRPHSLRQRGWSDIVELRRDQAAPPACCASSPWPAMPCGLLAWARSLCRASRCWAALACSPP